jgi:hypothetical protein
MEQEQLKNKNASTKFTCPRMEAIKELQIFITQLQEQQHSIILILDANQMSKACYSKEK